MERTGHLRVPGATLYYEVRGSGPALLISQSGEGDANRSDDLVAQLVTDHTVITYDRRGLSRSVLDTPGGKASVAQHADDVHRLLAALTDEPVTMLGCSLGAVIGLHLAVAHPGLLTTLVAHEPVAPWLLPDDERARHVRELVEIQDVYEREGLAATFAQVARVLGIDPHHQDTEPDLTAQPMTPRRAENFAFFVRNDFTAVVDDALDLAAVAALKDGGPRIVPAVGRATPHAVFDHRCAEELAALVGADLVEFPGGHNGNTTHPRAYAATLRAVTR
ncbi:alpha/beta hydrolase [Nonomuraea sp. NPDC000554]|uniref:alpha/beta hydrolase n=1 Tax=Nonomuraea sp. NPDC000554 TaxID=3154259 RepID=UPI00332AB030